MSGIADMDGEKIVLNSPTITWLQLGDVLKNLGDFMCRGEISAEDKPLYQETASSLYQTQSSIKFIQENYKKIIESQKQREEIKL